MHRLRARRSLHGFRCVWTREARAGFDKRRRGGAGGDITSTFDHPEQTKLGECKLIEEITIGEDRLIHFSGVAKAEACTIVLRGASEPHPLPSPNVLLTVYYKI